MSRPLLRSRAAVDRVRYERMTTEELRAAFLVDDLFAPDEVRLLHWEPERTVIGAVVPRSRPLALPPVDEIRAPFFLIRRELGIVNIGGDGTVTVDGQGHPLRARDVLYVGRGARDVTFASDQSERPAEFYLVSHAAHAGHPTRLVRADEPRAQAIGAGGNASARVLRRYVHPEAVPTAQLVMGITETDAGNVWNTCPPHTHARRTEIYLYFGIEEGQAVFHFMGPPEATRHLVVRNRQAILSPPWSVHFGVGTSRYAFVWSMGGENQDFEDMDQVPLDRIS